jgi:hypothetical protein
MNTRLIRLTTAALALCAGVFVSHATETTVPPPTTDPVVAPRPELPDSVRELMQQFRAQRVEWLQSRAELLRQLRDATQEERLAIFQQLRDLGEEFRREQRELARSIREELRRIRDERRTSTGG